MELRSRRRLGSPPPLQRHGPGGADRISYLSDDMIILILERLRCMRTAVRTGLLSRRWRGLWTRLTDLAFRGVAPATVEAAFSRFNAVSPAGTVFQLDIHLPSRPEATEANSLLRAAALISPASVAFTIARNLRGPKHNINVIQLPYFQHATSIELDMHQFIVEPPAVGEFPALERLSISGAILHIGGLVSRCPRLRVLRAKLRGLGSRLLEQELRSLKDALRTREGEVAVSLDIRISVPTVSLLREAADLSPQELVYTNSCQTLVWPYTRHLPSLHRATSIEINMLGISFARPLHGELWALERLCIFRCSSIANLGEFVSNCPRLRVLRVCGALSGGEITVHSTSLQELVLESYTNCCGINIVTPELKQLTMEVQAGGDLGTSVLAPLVEKVSWRCSYTCRTPRVFGIWKLQSLSLQTMASNGERVLTDDGEDNAWSSVQQPPRAHVLSMDMCASDPTYFNLNIAREIGKLSVTEFSVVDIHLEPMAHVYGATLFRLLQALPVHSATRILKVNLVRSEKSEVTEACKNNCFCDEPKNWRSQSISLPHLEEAEIKGFNGEDHGFDFLELIFRCAPKLRKVTIKLVKRSKSFSPRGCAKKIYSISLAYPSVNFYVYLGSGRLVPHS